MRDGTVAITPTLVILGTGSLGTAGNSEIIGLTANTAYNVAVGTATATSKTTDAAGALTGLTDGDTYTVTAVPQVTANALQITQGVAAINGVQATGDIDMTLANTGDYFFISINGVHTGNFVYGTDFTNATELSTKLNANATFMSIATASTSSADIVTITVKTPGTIGNNDSSGTDAVEIMGSGDLNWSPTNGGEDVVPGTAEVANLTISTTPTATGNITVTVNGIAHIVAVTATETEAQVASAIKAKLVSDVVTGYTVTNSGAVITFTSTSTGNVTDISIPSTATFIVGGLQ